MATSKPLYQVLAALVVARANCEKNGNQEWHIIHSERIARLVKEYMPCGSGFDDGTRIDLDASSADRLVFETDYHHMNEGSYDGWTDHTVTVRPSFDGITITIGGRNRNDIKEYIHEVFSGALETEIEPWGAQ